MRSQRINGKFRRCNGKFEPCGGCCKCASQGYVQLTAAGIQSDGVDYSGFGPISTWSRSYPEGDFADGDYFVPRMTGDTACEYRKFVNNYGTALSRVLGPIGSGVTGCTRDMVYDVRFLGSRTIILIYLVGTRYLTPPPFDDRHVIFFSDTAIAPGTDNGDGTFTYANLIASPTTVITGTPVNGENYFYGGTMTLACATAEDVVADADGGSDDECVQPIDGDIPDCFTCNGVQVHNDATGLLTMSGFITDIENGTGEADTFSVSETLYLFSFEDNVATFKSADGLLIYTVNCASGAAHVSATFLTHGEGTNNVTECFLSVGGSATDMESTINYDDVDADYGEEVAKFTGDAIFELTPGSKC